MQKLLPGHFLEFSDGIVRTTRWVQPAFLPGDAPVSPAEIEEVLRDSAAAHKVADVEVAGFLSGGVDSAYLDRAGPPPRAPTISYAEPKYDESFPARALARSLGVRNRACGASAPASSGTPCPPYSTTWTSRWLTLPPWRSTF